MATTTAPPDKTLSIVKWTLVVVIPLIALVAVLVIIFVPVNATHTFSCTVAGGECKNGGICVAGSCKCVAGWQGVDCSIQTAQPTSTSTLPATALCDRAPQLCTVDSDCLVCAGGGEYTCQSVQPEQTSFNIAGNFCLPSKPVSLCTAPTTNPSLNIPGVWRWEGWQATNTMDWTCECENPLFYPMDIQTGQCTKSSAVCRHGTWTYPCARDAPNNTLHCKNLTPEETSALIGTAPLWNGLCECTAVPCTNDTQCAVACVNGQCINQRLDMDINSGVPSCVPDTCLVNMTCNNAQDCPAGIQCTDGVCDLQSAPPIHCTSASDCAGLPCNATTQTCDTGHWNIANWPPYVYGECACPSGYSSAGTHCVKKPS